MQARSGDRLLVRSHHLGEPDREATVLEVLGKSDTAHYKVRWNDGHESVFFPSADCTVRPPAEGGDHG